MICNSNKEMERKEGICTQQPRDVGKEADNGIDQLPIVEVAAGSITGGFGRPLQVVPSPSGGPSSRCLGRSGPRRTPMSRQRVDARESGLQMYVRRSPIGDDLLHAPSCTDAVVLYGHTCLEDVHVRVQ